MAKQSLSSIAKNVRTAMKRHSPEILTGIGIAGMVTSTVLAVRATPKALDLIAERQHEVVDGNLTFSKLTTMETVKTAWKCYIPAVLVGCTSIACLIGASSENVRRNAALATAYTLSESALKEYQEKVVETIGEKKEQSVRDNVAKEQLNKNPVSNNEVIVTKKGDTLCYDPISGRYFDSDIDFLKRAVIELNRQLLDDVYVSLNDFYYEIGLSNNKAGDILGWCVDDGRIDPRFSSALADDGRPCLVLNYTVAPHYEFDR